MPFTFWPLRPTHRRRAPIGLGVATALAVALGACGSGGATATKSPTTSPGGAGPTVTGAGSTAGTAAPVESSPPGDIPDTVAYVTWTSPDSATRFVHPEGWAQAAAPGGVTFSDKLNSVTVTSMPGPPPTVADVATQVAPTLAGPGRAPKVVKTEAATLPAGPAVKITWQVNSVPDAVTGKVFRDEVITYLVGSAGRVVRMDLSGAIGSDNVDPYRKMSDSLVLR